MTFTVLAVRPGDDPESPLYPQPQEAPDTVETEADDGAAQVFRAEGVSVASVLGPKPITIGRFNDVKIKVSVTSTRTIVAPSKYDKGEGWTQFSVGALPVTMAANAVSKARARGRRKGKMLVGHVRHEWLMRVDSCDRTGLGSHNKVHLLLADPLADGALLLEVRLNNQTPGSQVANEIICRAALHRADRTSDPALADRLREYATKPTRERLDQRTWNYQLPIDADPVLSPQRT